jgi:Tetratricopeptide repeat/NB-ARC domain
MCRDQTGRTVGVRQETRAERDAYSAARDVIIHHHHLPRVKAAQVQKLARHVWSNVPARNPGFTGRMKLLAEVRKRLLAGDRTVVQALHGIGGVGKTQLAVEYTHRFADDYDLVWWITAEQPGLIGAQFVPLAEALGCDLPGAELGIVRRAVLAELRERDRWLLVFDNAEDPEDVMEWLPGGSGHVLITSRAHRWADIAVPVEIDVLTRRESVVILRDRVPGLPARDADQVAAALGDLPLAVAQAAATMADTGMPAGEYTGLLATRAAEILDHGRPVSYPRSLAAVTQLAFDRLRCQDPAAADLAGICAFLAPETIPADWFTRAAAELPGPLRELIANPVARRQMMSRIGQNALARVHHGGLLMHRLTQAIVREHLSANAAIRSQAEAVMVANHPGDLNDPGTWPRWTRMLPHLLALNPGGTSSMDLRGLAIDAASYLNRRGDTRGAYDLARHLHDQWRNRLGPDDYHTLHAIDPVTEALGHMGRHDEARLLNEDVLARCRRVLGENHPGTLNAAINLAIQLHALGESRAARAIGEDALARCRRVLGENHPDTLAAANNLAIYLRAVGETRAARALGEDILARCRRVLGENNFGTLHSANNLAADLRALGEIEAAWKLDVDTLSRRRRVLGEDHPDTVHSASNLADDLRALGEIQAASK